MLAIAPQALTKPMVLLADSASLKHKYNRLGEYL